ncbi:MAG: stage III sporulation protein AF [Clostridia bacterium]|nr:stage III sporulation protein AF [Clostridia bacterium]
MALSAWVFCITGVAVLTLMVDVLLPSGDTAKYIKAVFSLLTVLILTLPIPSILRGETSISFEVAEVEIQEGFIDYLTQSKLEVVQSEAEYILTQNGIEASVTAYGELTGGNIELILLEIYVSGVINNQSSHIVVSEKIENCLATKVYIDKNIISVIFV